MKYPLAFGIIGIGGLLIAFLHRGAAWLLLWPAGSFLVVAAAYTFQMPAVFGKDLATGRLRWTNRLILGPYLGLTVILWHLGRLVSREPAYNLLTKSIYLGRRLLVGEFPPGVSSIVDLTAELDSAHGAGVEYVNIAVLDGCVPPAAEFRRAVLRIAALPGPVLIHCAQGHGRTSTFAAALLLELGECATVDEALLLVQAVRPAASPNATQRNMLSHAERLRTQA